jgi:hypothetical protein
VREYAPTAYYVQTGNHKTQAQQPLNWFAGADFIREEKISAWDHRGFDICGGGGSLWGPRFVAN